MSAKNIHNQQPIHLASDSYSCNVECVMLLKAYQQQLGCKHISELGGEVLKELEEVEIQ